MTDIDKWIAEHKRRGFRPVINLITRDQFPATLITGEPLILAIITPHGEQWDWWDIFSESGARIDSLQVRHRLTR